MSNFILLRRIELGATTASISFTDIPQTGYSDLRILISARSSFASTSDRLSIAFNGTSISTNWTRRSSYQTNIGSVSESGTNSYICSINGSTSQANTFSNIDIKVSNFTSSLNKPVAVEAVTGASTDLSMVGGIWAAQWANTSAITSLTLTPETGSFLANSNFSLYALAN